MLVYTIWRQLTESLCPVRVLIFSFLLIFQSLTVLSVDPETIVSSDTTAIHSTKCLWPFSVDIILPDFKFMSLIVLSAEPVINTSFDKKLMQLIQLEWSSLNSLTNCPVSKLKILTLLSWELLNT